VSVSDLPGLYRDGRERFVALARDLTPDELAVVVPACPAWSVRDVIAHLSGVAEDVAVGNTAGATTDTWSAAQVRRGRDVPVDDLLARWETNAPAVEELLAAHPRRWAAVVDVAAHEQDVRGAVGRPGARDNPVILALTPALLTSIGVPAPLVIRTEDGEVRVGPEDAPGDGAPVALSTTRFEAFRWRLGRRSRAQVAGLDWSADPSPYLDHLFVFGPSPTDVIE
jgi:uncharacterized protein (TIGR03083 family)